MKTINSFEDMKVWQDARGLVSKIYRITSSEPLRRDLYLRDQLRKTSISIMANIAEGFERNGNREFTQFLSNAKGSVGELRSHLYVAFDCGMMDHTEHVKVINQVVMISRQLAGMIRYLRQSSKRGSKFLQPGAFGPDKNYF